MISAITITYNEEKKLEDCLKSVQFVDEIVIVDSHSQDRTKELALKNQKVRFFERHLDNFSDQKNYALDQARGEWLLLIDADERITEGLKDEILALIKKQSACNGYYLRRENYMFGGKVSHGINSNDLQLRLIKNGKGTFQGLVHERIEIDGKVGILKNSLIHTTYQTLDEYFTKFNLFSSLDAKEIFKRGKRPSWFDFGVKPFMYFFYYYFFKLGFLDGMRGLICHILASFYTFVKNVKAIQYYESGK
jgi:glycosyltransferase involved in cell wall biosynthesis